MLAAYHPTRCRRGSRSDSHRRIQSGPRIGSKGLVKLLGWSLRLIMQGISHHSSGLCAVLDQVPFGSFSPKFLHTWRGNHELTFAQLIVPCFGPRKGTSALE